MAQGERARRTETPDDVVGVLASARASLSEWIDCIDVSRRHHRWDLVDAVGDSILRDIVARPDARIPTLAEAARSVAMAYMSRIEHLDDLAPGTTRVIATLRDAQNAVPKSSGAAKAFAREIDWLDELRVLASDTSSPALTQLCARLRDIDRSDLGAEAGRRALEKDPENVAARTTLAAALVDQERTDLAIANISTAWEQEPSAYVANVFSRALLHDGQLEEALEMAYRAFDLDAGPVSQRMLLAAAAAAPDGSALIDAQALIKARGRDGSGDGLRDHRLVDVLAAEARVESGFLDEGELMARALLVEPGAWKARIQQLLNRIVYLRRKQQGRLDFS